LFRHANDKVSAGVAGMRFHDGGQAAKIKVYGQLRWIERTVRG
jgi:hypothetical protein